jgi:hypothetical protein
VEREKVQNPPCLLDVILGIRAQAVHQIRELHTISDEENLTEANRLAGRKVISTHQVVGSSKQAITSTTKNNVKGWSPTNRMIHRPCQNLKNI